MLLSVMALVFWVFDYPVPYDSDKLSYSNLLNSKILAFPVFAMRNEFLLFLGIAGKNLSKK